MGFPLQNYSIFKLQKCMYIFWVGSTTWYNQKINIAYSFNKKFHQWIIIHVINVKCAAPCSMVGLRISLLSIFSGGRLCRVQVNSEQVSLEPLAEAGEWIYGPASLVRKGRILHMLVQHNWLSSTIYGCNGDIAMFDFWLLNSYTLTSKHHNTSCILKVTDKFWPSRQRSKVRELLYTIAVAPEYEAHSLIPPGDAGNTIWHAYLITYWPWWRETFFFLGHVGQRNIWFNIRALSWKITGSKVTKDTFIETMGEQDSYRETFALGREYTVSWVGVTILEQIVLAGKAKLTCNTLGRNWTSLQVCKTGL